jgi:hypothetical protein
LGSLFAALALVFLAPLLLPTPAFRKIYFAVLVAFSLTAWIVSNFLFGDYGMFNGEELSIDDRSLHAFLELAAGIALVIALVRYKQLASTFGDLVIGIFLLTLIAGAYQWQQNQKSNAVVKMRSDLSLEKLNNEKFDQLSNFSTRANIIHILLDELQTDVFEQALIQNPALGEDLDGFTFFPNTSSVFPYTQMSLPAILSGEVYNNRGSKAKYLDRSFHRNAFFRGLEQAGYQLEFHIHPAFCTEATQLNCSAVAGNSILPTALNLVDLSLFRAVPTAVKRTVYNDGMGVFKRFLSEGGYLDSQPGIGFLLFDKLNQNFSVNDGPPTYKFFQSLITHAPQLMESDCSLSGAINPLTMPHMKKQTECAFSKVTELLDKLDKKGIYDKTLIVISSDHGGNYLDSSKKETLKSRSIPGKHFARGKSTLLIKPFNTRGTLQQSEYPARLSDIPRTISELATLGFSKHGENIFSQEYDPQRLREFYFIDWGLAARESDRLNGFKPYHIKGDVRDATSWNRVVGGPKARSKEK